ncbi:glycoside hydrolase family 47 protein [Zasmidium cellare ATCC 36951]|uniref:alpha-1,2-Mannosidase n=1 Tax=Zasmidium cellare ATCC 36951 TaxID=1080233 RepID=A0A6A6CI63_ZASCE|nr:glycoside hydrolase family 47 protein [Zasmidium cellare ATCC 36951]KAF2166303.1 glycoside hydrolase family 47 protein [Zasmidium cellare ATCC 36951]
MPGRTRRVRLLAVAVCIFTVFFLYQRNEARVEEYADYFTKSAVGGGSVLRKEQQQQEPIPRPQADPALDLKPASRPEADVEPAPTTSSSVALEATESPTPTPEPTSTRNAVWKEQSSTLAVSPSFDDDELPVEVGLGRIEDDYEYGNPFLPTTSHEPIHWSKLPEHFPISTTIQLPSGKPSPIPLIQKQGQAKGSVDKDRRAAVRDACKWAWAGFRKKGWGFDEVEPVSGIGKNSFNGWGATLVDSLDTLWIMGMKEEFEDAVNKTAEIDFTISSRSDIPLFEVTIRYLGGLIAAYDVSDKKYRVLLDKAVELAEILYSAFDTPNRMPETYYYWKPTLASNARRAGTRVVMAELGTLSLEFTRLAQLTGEPKYYDAIARITDEFEKWQNNTRLPGMWPTMLDASGCKKPEYVPPSRTYNQMPAPQGDSYMISSEPVKVDEKVVAAAEDTLNKQNTPAKGFKGPNKAHAEDKLGSVANPAVGNVMAGVSDSDASLRHPMAEHPSGSDPNWGSSGEDTTNAAKAKDPLKPGAGAANDQKTSMDGFRAVDPLPPNAGIANPHIKRQLEQFSDLSEAVSNKTTSNSAMHHQDLRQLDYENNEPACLPQGLASSGKNVQETYTLGGQSDSTYEYLPKQYLLLGGRLDQYKDMYLASMKPVVDELLFKPMTPENRDILVSGEVHMSFNYTTGEPILSHIPKGEHLTCFVGGMFGLGGKIFDVPEHIDLARKLTDGCIWSYNVTKSGIMPESFSLASCADSKDLKVCQWNETEYDRQLDPYMEFREDQRTTFMEQYEIENLEVYEKELAVASSSLAAAVARASKTAVPYLGEDDEEARTASLADEMRALNKRQLNDFDEFADEDEDFPAAPKPASSPRPTTSPSPEFESDPDDIWGGYGGPAAEDYEYTMPARPIYTPPPPPTHQQYVMQKVEDERLPPGFIHLDSRKYILRPEAIESVFYMYRITGEKHWQDMGWNMFQAAEGLSRTTYGHSALDDVTKSRPSLLDGMESFWIAETLKYYYLLFDDPDQWSLDDWVLNTEAHFFQRPENPIKS